MLGFAVLMVFFSMLHDISSTNEVFPTSARYDNNYNVGNVQPLHETGLRWGFHLLMVLMNIMLLKQTWKTCGNRDRLGSRITTIQSHGHSLR